MADKPYTEARANTLSSPPSLPASSPTSSPPAPKVLLSPISDQFNPSPSFISANTEYCGSVPPSNPPSGFEPISSDTYFGLTSNQPSSPLTSFNPTGITGQSSDLEPLSSTSIEVPLNRPRFVNFSIPHPQAYGWLTKPLKEGCEAGSGDHNTAPSEPGLQPAKQSIDQTHFGCRADAEYFTLSSPTTLPSPLPFPDLPTSVTSNGQDAPSLSVVRELRPVTSTSSNFRAASASSNHSSSSIAGVSLARAFSDSPSTRDSPRPCVRPQPGAQFNSRVQSFRTERGHSKLKAPFQEHSLTTNLSSRTTNISQKPIFVRHSRVLSPLGPPIPVIPSHRISSSLDTFVPIRNRDCESRHGSQAHNQEDSRAQSAREAGAAGSDRKSAEVTFNEARGPESLSDMSSPKLGNQQQIEKMVVKPELLKPQDQTSLLDQRSLGLPNASQAGRKDSPGLYIPTPDSGVAFMQTASQAAATSTPQLQALFHGALFNSNTSQASPAPQSNSSFPFRTSRARISGSTASTDRTSVFTLSPQSGSISEGGQTPADGGIKNAVVSAGGNCTAPEKPSPILEQQNGDQRTLPQLHQVLAQQCGGFAATSFWKAPEVKVRETPDRVAAFQRMSPSAHRLPPPRPSRENTVDLGDLGYSRPRTVIQSDLTSLDRQGSRARKRSSQIRTVSQPAKFISNYRQSQQHESHSSLALDENQKPELSSLEVNCPKLVSRAPSTVTRGRFGFGSLRGTAGSSSLGTVDTSAAQSFIPERPGTSTGGSQRTSLSIFPFSSQSQETITNKEKDKTKGKDKRGKLTDRQSGSTTSSVSSRITLGRSILPTFGFLKRKEGRKNEALASGTGGGTLGGLGCVSAVDFGYPPCGVFDEISGPRPFKSSPICLARPATAQASVCPTEMPSSHGDASKVPPEKSTPGAEPKLTSPVQLSKSRQRASSVGTGHDAQSGSYNEDDGGVTGLKGSNASVVEDRGQGRDRVRHASNPPQAYSNPKKTGPMRKSLGSDIPALAAVPTRSVSARSRIGEEILCSRVERTRNGGTARESCKPTTHGNDIAAIGNHTNDGELAPKFHSSPEEARLPTGTSAQVRNSELEFAPGPQIPSFKQSSAMPRRKPVTNSAAWNSEDIQDKGMGSMSGFGVSGGVETGPGAKPRKIVDEIEVRIPSGSDGLGSHARNSSLPVGLDVPIREIPSVPNRAEAGTAPATRSELAHTSRLNFSQRALAPLTPIITSGAGNAFKARAVSDGPSLGVVDHSVRRPTGPLPSTKGISDSELRPLILTNSPLLNNDSAQAVIESFPRPPALSVQPPSSGAPSTAVSSQFSPGLGLSISERPIQSNFWTLPHYALEEAQDLVSGINLRDLEEIMREANESATRSPGLRTKLLPNVVNSSISRFENEDGQSGGLKSQEDYQMALPERQNQKTGALVEPWLAHLEPVDRASIAEEKAKTEMPLLGARHMIEALSSSTSTVAALHPKPTALSPPPFLPVLPARSLSGRHLRPGPLRPRNHNYPTLHHSSQQPQQQPLTEANLRPNRSNLGSRSSSASGALDDAYWGEYESLLNEILEPGSGAALGGGGAGGGGSAGVGSASKIKFLKERIPTDSRLGSSGSDLNVPVPSSATSRVFGREASRGFSSFESDAESGRNEAKERKGERKGDSESRSELGAGTNSPPVSSQFKPGNLDLENTEKANSVLQSSSSSEQSGVALETAGVSFSGNASKEQCDVHQSPRKGAPARAKRAKPEFHSSSVVSPQVAPNKLLATPNLRFAALLISRYLTFGRVLFSPVHSEASSVSVVPTDIDQDPESGRINASSGTGSGSSPSDGSGSGCCILVIDGLGRDFSFYLALTYPQAQVCALSPSPVHSRLGRTSPATISAFPPPPNHKLVYHPDLPSRLPFAANSFSAVILRFPPIMPSSLFQFLLSECNRVLVPGGYVEYIAIDADLVNMGEKARQGVRKVKVKVCERINGVDLRPLGDGVVKGLGGAGLEGIRTCCVGIPVHPKKSAPSSSLRGNSASAADVVSAGVDGPSRKNNQQPTSVTLDSSFEMPQELEKVEHDPEHFSVPDARETSVGSEEDIASSHSPTTTTAAQTRERNPSATAEAQKTIAKCSTPGIHYPLPQEDQRVSEMAARVGRWWYWNSYERVGERAVANGQGRGSDFSTTTTATGITGTTSNATPPSGSKSWKADGDVWTVQDGPSGGSFAPSSSSLPPPSSFSSSPPPPPPLAASSSAELGTESESKNLFDDPEFLEECRTLGTAMRVVVCVARKGVGAGSVRPWSC